MLTEHCSVEYIVVIQNNVLWKEEEPVPKLSKQPEERRQELVDIALRQFMQLGYEKTSVRSIVGEAGGEVGMFYHYFKSKEELFRVALRQFNVAYVRGLAALVEENPEEKFAEMLDRVFEHLAASVGGYRAMQPEHVDEQVLLLLHRQALAELVPVFARVLERYSERGEIAKPAVDTSVLAGFLLHGASSVIHGPQRADAAASVKLLAGKLLGAEME